MKTVCCVMLANGREAMVQRAVASFKAQSYPYKCLLVYDNSAEYGASSKGLDNAVDIHVHAYPTTGRTIGMLRNAANELAARDCIAEILLHWDSDDWSHPNRIAEQVALLEASKRQAVGYRDMLFWDSRPGQFCGAWLYTNPNERYCLGTSLCYWRSVWESKPFSDLPNRRGSTGEDTQWLQGLDSQGVSSLTEREAFHGMYTLGPAPSDGKPRMIASIHGGNTMPYDEEKLSAPNFQRVPEWDAHCREVMAL